MVTDSIMVLHTEKAGKAHKHQLLPVQQVVLSFLSRHVLLTFACTTPVRT